MVATPDAAPTDLLWKAVDRDWTSRGGVRWDVGETVVHPTSTAMTRDIPRTCLSMSTEPGETLLGRSWPCRLLRVEPVGEVLDSGRWPHRRCALAVRVVAEVEPWRALGPNGRTVAAVIDRVERLTDDEARSLAATWRAAGTAAWVAAWVAAGAAARNAAGDVARTAIRTAARNAAGAVARTAARNAARNATRAAAAAAEAAEAAAGAAAGAVVVADLITSEQYATLIAPLMSIVGPFDELPVPAWVDEPATGGRHA